MPSPPPPSPLQLSQDEEDEEDEGTETFWSRVNAWMPWSKSTSKGLLGQGLAKQIGNITECALLGFLVDLGEPDQRLVLYFTQL